MTERFPEATCLNGYNTHVIFCVQLVQVIINTTHLEQSCHFLEEFISNITNVPPDTANATKLYGTSTFKVRRRASFCSSISPFSFLYSVR